MKVLVTGATGFLGSHLCRRFVLEGHEVTAFRRPESNTALLADLTLRHVLGDITEPEAVNEAVKGQDVVIHAAAHLAYWRRVRDVQARINVDGTRHVVQACQQAGVRRLVHVSSVAAIGIPQAQRPADETFRFNLDNSGLNYHLSKHRAEQEVQRGCVNGLEAVIVNPGSIFGPHGRSFRGGEMIEKVRRRRVVPYFLGGINVVHVDDVVDGIVRALKLGQSGERYILGGENLTYRRIAEMAAERLRLARQFVPVPPLVTGLAAALTEPVSAWTGKRPRFTYEVHYCSSHYQFYDSSKARKELGFAPRSFEAIVAAYLAQAAN